MTESQIQIPPADYGCLDADWELKTPPGYVRRGSTAIHARTAYHWLACPVKGALRAEFKRDTAHPTAPNRERRPKSVMLQLASDVVTNAITSDTSYTDADVDRLIRIGLDAQSHIRYDRETGTYHELRQKTKTTARQMDLLTKDLFANCVSVCESNPAYATSIDLPYERPSSKEVEFRADTWLRGLRPAAKLNIVAFYGHKSTWPDVENARVGTWAGIIWQAYERERKLGQDLDIYSVSPGHECVEAYRVNIESAMQHYAALMDTLTDWYLNTGSRRPYGPAQHCGGCAYADTSCLLGVGTRFQSTKGSPTCYWK